MHAGLGKGCNRPNLKIKQPEKLLLQFNKITHIYFLNIQNIKILKSHKTIDDTILESLRDWPRCSFENAGKQCTGSRLDQMSIKSSTPNARMFIGKKSRT